MMKKTFYILFVLFASLQMSYGQEWKVKIGDQIPQFQVVNKAGEKIGIADLKGKVVLVSFFATWCPPCREELPRFQKELWDAYKDRKDFYVMVLAREQGWDKLDPFMSSNNYTFPVFPDLKREVFSLFAEQSIPRNVLINKEGKIIYQSIGYEEAEFSGLVKLIEQELKK